MKNDKDVKNINLNIRFSRKLQNNYESLWCSVDLRDGNQSLIEPMNLAEKFKFYQKLLKIGFKEIEVGFPAAAAVEYEFMRFLIEDNQIPEEVNIQVLCQAREMLIEKTISSLKGAKKAIFHLYNSLLKLRERCF